MGGEQETKLKDDKGNTQNEEYKDLPRRWLATLRKSDPPYIYAFDIAKEDTTKNNDVWEAGYCNLLI